MTKPLKAYFCLFFFLVLFGMVMVFNIKVFSVDSPDLQVWRILKSLTMNLLVASIGFGAAFLVNVDALRAWIKYALIAIIILLLATFVIGTDVNGSRRWINLGIFMLQPSEFAKIVAVFYLSEVICNKRERIGLLKELVYPFGLISLIVIIIAVEDLGTGIIILGVSMILLLMGGMKFKYLTVLVILASLVIAILILMKPYRMKRIEAFYDPFQYEKTIGYQQVQSQIAMGRGGLAGVGFGNSQRKMRYLPEASTDFIFAIIGEEFGFVGSTSVILLYLSLFIGGIYFALSRTNSFYMYLISGFVLILCIQSLINIGVVTSSIPNKGVPLPFISYGGSALLSYSMMMGFIINSAAADNRYFSY